MTLLDKPRFWRGVLSAFLALLAFIGFWPSPVDKPIRGEIAGVLNFLHAHGIPAWINYASVEASANVALFFPLGVAAFLTFPGKRWWQAAAFGMMVSGCMELGQQLFLPDRFSSPVDVVTNSLGSVMGVLMARAAIRYLKQRQAQHFSALSLSKTSL